MAPQQKATAAGDRPLNRGRGLNALPANRLDGLAILRTSETRSQSKANWHCHRNTGSKFHHCPPVLRYRPSDGCADVEVLVHCRISAIEPSMVLPATSLSSTLS